MDIKSEIHDFVIQKEHSGALLLTGKWGAGKTYLLRAIADDFKKAASAKATLTDKKTNDQDTYLFAFVSLFGLESAEALSKKVNSSVLFAALNTSEEKMNKVKALGNAVTKVSELSEKAAPVIGKLKNVVSVNLYDLIDITSNALLKGRSLVLVFDDFERSVIPLEIRIGAINEYVENKKIRTIIIADEDRIKEEEYKSFKEKVVVRTLRFCPDVDVILSQIIDAYEETEPVKGYKAFLIAHKSCMVFAAEESQSDNIRTLKSILIDFERVFRLWINKGYSVDSVELSDLFYSFAAMAYEVKAGSDKLDDIRKKYRYFGKSGSNLNTLQEWLTTGIWDEDSIIAEIQKKIFPPKKDDEYKFLNYSPWDLDGDIIACATPTVLQKAYTGEYSGGEYLSLLQTIVFFRENNLQILDGYDSKRLLRGWKEHEKKVRDGLMTEVKPGRFIMPDQVAKMDENEKVLYAMIEHLDYKIPSWQARSTLLEAMEKQTVQDARKIDGLYELDDDLLKSIISYYKVCPNPEKRALFCALGGIAVSRISPNEEKEKTIQNFEKLSSFLKKYAEATTDPISRLQANAGINQIIEQIKRQ